MSFDASFKIGEIISFLGLAQSLYVLVYMLLRSGNWRYAVIPSAYFLALSFAFLLDAASGRIGSSIMFYIQIQNFFWFASVPLAVLLIFQVGQIAVPPSPRLLWFLGLVPLMVIPGPLFGSPELNYISGLVLGGLSLLGLWLRRDIFADAGKSPKLMGERFWLILCLIVMNVGFLGSVLAYVSQIIPYGEWMMIRTLLGIGVVYVSATSLFRIYPQAVKLDRKPAGDVSGEDQAVLDKVYQLLDRDKVYQEPEYGRAELARELGIGEATLSRIINQHFSKTIPQILNEYRVKDAQRLLRETDVPIQQVFEESGFNSITTFNRVFKELAGDSPKEYRHRYKT